MYDELIKNLRHDSASALQNCEFDFVYDWMLEAADAIEDLENRLNLWRQDKIRRWIPVTERLPKNHQHCLVFTDTHRMGYFAKNLEKVDEYDFQGEKHHGWYYLDSEWGYCEIRNVSYWMPLPQPPEVET